MFVFVALILIERDPNDATGGADIACSMLSREASPSLEGSSSSSSLKSGYSRVPNGLTL